MDTHYSIKIDRNNKDVCSINLPDILAHIYNGQNIKWAILWIYAVGNLGENVNMLDFEKEVDDSKNGFLIDWKDLIDLSKKFDDLMELLLIGTEQVEKLKKYDIEEKMYSTCDYTIELIDSSYWLIHSNDYKKLELISEKLPGIENIFD